MEDEENLHESLKLNLELQGYEVTSAFDGTHALKAVKEEYFDLIVLDIMLPEVDGISVAETIRISNNEVPILMLSARNTSSDIVLGLKKGADDYLTKPFSPRELVARIKAVLRRRAPQLTEDAVSMGGLRLDPMTHRVHAHDHSVGLGPTEFRLLHFMMTHPERVHSRSQLLDQVWGDHVFVEERTVDVHIRRLRSALEPYKLDGLIQTVRGSGYRFSATASE